MHIYTEQTLKCILTHPFNHLLSFRFEPWRSPLEDKCYKATFNDLIIHCKKRSDELNRTF